MRRLLPLFSSEETAFDLTYDPLVIRLARGFELAALVLLIAVVGWSFWLAARFPIDSWDAYDYLVNARWLAGHDLSRLSQRYRPDRPPGISLLAAPLLALGYQPGQRGLTGLVHLIPWSFGIAAVALLANELKSLGRGMALLGALALLLNPLLMHALPLMMADVVSMTFVFASLVLAERVMATPSPRLVLALLGTIAGSLCSKYPVAAIGLTIPLASALSVLWGEGRVRGVRQMLLGILRPWLAFSLLGGLALFFVVHAIIYARLVDGDATWFVKLTTGLGSAWNSGSGGGPLDPWWELPRAVGWSFGAPLIGFALVGAVLSCWRGERRGLLHTTWVIGFLLLFSTVIGHRESRYAMPVLPSVAWLAMRGLSVLAGPRRWLAVFASFGALAVPSIGEFKRMQDPLYTQPTILGWARAALDAAGADRPIFQSPIIANFALYPKNPVVLETDEYWHYHHFNEGGLVWFFDRRLLALRVLRGQRNVVTESPWVNATVPEDWLSTLGDDAVWLSAFPRGAVIVGTSQGWYETNSAASQPEPPRPFDLTDVRHLTLERNGMTFSDGVETVTARQDVDGFRFSGGPAGARWFASGAGTPRTLLEVEPVLPERIEALITTHQTFPIRP